VISRVRDSELLAENALRRQQVIVLRRSIGQPRLHRDDRLVLLALARLNRRWRDTLCSGAQSGSAASCSKWGIRVSKRTIQKYMTCARPPGKRGQTCSTFLKNHTGELWACDFLQLYDALFRPIFAFFIVNHGTREVVHFNVTRCPTDAWVTRQLREATPRRRPVIPTRCPEGWQG
jgi:hypothetical protein